MSRMKELEAENARLKRIYAEGRLKAETLKEAIEKSGEAISSTRDGTTSSQGVCKQYPSSLQCL